jgi:hypothetical protein
MHRLKFIWTIGLLFYLFNSSAIYAQWTQTNGPIDSLTVFSILPCDSVVFASTNEGLFYTTKLPGQWKRLTYEDTRACTTIGNQIFAADEKWGIIIADLSKPNFIVDTIYDMGRDLKTICSANSYFYICVGTDAIFRYRDSPKDYESYTLTIPDSVRPYCRIHRLTIIDSTLFCLTSIGIFKYNINKMEMLSANNGLPEGNVQMLEVIHDSLFTGINNQLYISTDNGDSWRFFSSFSSKVTSIDELNGMICVSTLEDGLYMSKNGGQTWNPFNSGLTTPQIKSLKKWKNLLLCGTSKDGLFYTSDSVWNNGNKGMICTGISTLFPSKNSIIAYENGTIYLLSDSVNWEKITQGIWKIDNMCVSNDTIIYTPSFGSPLKGSICYSFDRGKNWDTIQSNPFPKIEPYRIFYKFNKLYITDNGIIYYTDDWGGSWNEIKIPDNTYDLLNCNVTQDLTFCDKQLQYFLLSKDDNPTWVSHADGLYQRYFVKFLIYTSDAFYANVYLYVYVKSDSCPFWTRVSNIPSWNVGIRSFAYYGKNLFISYYKGVSYTDDYGRTWKNLNTGLQDSTSIGALIINNNTLYAGTGGSGIWKYDLGTIHFSESATCPCNREKILFYPNPVSNYLYIQTDYSPIVEIKISDMRGNLILNRKIDSTKPVNLSELPNGIYLITIQTDDDYSFTGKLLKIN